MPPASPSPSSSSSPLRPVILTLYRHLIKLSQSYGRVAQAAKQTVQQEIDKVLITPSISTHPSTTSSGSSTTPSRGSRRRPMGDSIRVSAFPLPLSNDQNSTAALLVQIATPEKQRAGDTEGDTETDSEHIHNEDSSSSSRVSSESSSSPSPSPSPSPPSPWAPLLLSCSLVGNETMTPRIARLLVHAQFSLYKKQTRPAVQQKLIAQGFTVMRKMKDREHRLAANIGKTNSSKAQAAAQGLSNVTTTAADSDRENGPMQSLTHQSTYSVAAPQLDSLSTSATTKTQHTNIHIQSFLHGIHPALPGPRSMSSSTVGPFTFTFSYTVTITNIHPTHWIQLLARHWVITDSAGGVVEVKGEGVVGQQPILKPHQQYVYSSGTALREKRGKMEGKLHFVILDEHTLQPAQPAADVSATSTTTPLTSTASTTSGSPPSKKSKSSSKSTAVSSGLTSPYFEASVGPLLFDARRELGEEKDTTST